MYGFLAFYPLILIFIIIILFKSNGVPESRLLNYTLRILLIVIYLPVIVYCIDANKLKNINQKIWQFSFITLGFITMPIYWYHYILKNKK